MRSPNFGATTIRVGEEEIALRLDYSALDKLEGEWGPGWHVKIDSVLAQSRPGDLALMLSVASGRPVDFWYRESPPIVPAVDALRRAVSLSFFGSEGPPDVDPPRRPRTMLARLWHRVFGRGPGPD